MSGADAAITVPQPQPQRLAPPPGNPHVAVVGAGAFGGWTALHLRRRGARVTLFDAWGPGNARSSSGDESRVLRGIYGRDRVYVTLLVRALEQWKTCEREWHQALYQPTGVLWMFTGDHEYGRDALPLMVEHGLSVAELSPAEASRRFPQIDFAGVRTAYLEDEAGFLLARQACLAVLRALLDAQAEYRQVAVRPGPITSGEMPWIELSDGTRFTADHYVFACGPWLPELFPELLGTAISSSRQEVFYFGTPAGDHRFRAPRLPVWIEFGDPILCGIPDADCRGFKLESARRGPAFDPTHGDRHVTPDGLERARAHLARRFPELAAAPVLESRVCQYDDTPDGHYLIDRHPAATNAWIVGGGSGHGFKLGPAVGEYVASRLLHGGELEAAFSLSRLSQDVPRTTQWKNPPRPGP